MQEITEKLKDILATEGRKSVKNIDVALALGIKPNAYAQMKFRNAVPYKQILNFLHRRGISINLFFYGDEAKNTHRYKILRLYDSVASLGGGVLNENATYENIVLDEQILSFYRASNCDVIRSVGESMEDEIKDGDLCVIEKDERQIKSGGIYAINTLEGLFVKECRVKGDELEMISLNPVYEPMRYRLDEIMVVGKLKGTLHKIG